MLYTLIFQFSMVNVLLTQTVQFYFIMVSKFVLIYIFINHVAAQRTMLTYYRGCNFTHLMLIADHCCNFDCEINKSLIVKLGP